MSNQEDVHSWIDGKECGCMHKFEERWSDGDRDYIVNYDEVEKCPFHLNEEKKEALKKFEELLRTMEEQIVRGREQVARLKAEIQAFEELNKKN